jgi:molybdopterin synthase sulfur carrier subunit
MSSIPQPAAGHFNILYFASASSYTGKPHESLPAPFPLKKLFGLLEEMYDGIKDKVLESCLVTINFSYVEVPSEEDSDETMIRDGDEVAIIPPVSSG